MNSKSIDQLIDSKYQKLTIIRNQQASLEAIESYYAGESFGRVVNSSYLFIKWLAFLLVGIAFLLLSLMLMIAPERLTQDEEIRQELIDETKEEYLIMAEDIVGNAIIEMAKSGREPSASRIADQLGDSFDKVILEEINETIQGFGVLILIFAVFLIYTSRSARKLRLRNKRIKEAQGVTREVIKEFISLAELESEELEQMKELKNTQIAQNAPPSLPDKGETSPKED